MERPELFVKMALQAWEIQVKRAGNLMIALSDEQIMHEIAPGRNRGIYLFGHLIASNDALNTLLGLGERLHPELDEPFLSNPDKSPLPLPSLDDLRKYWPEVHGRLADAFGKLTPEQWFLRHTAMTDEDYIKEPHRNRLAVVISRTSHIAYHAGQLLLLK